MTDKLPTKKQKAMLDFIQGFISGNGYSPTLREIMRSLDYKSVSTVAKHIDNLVASGYLIKRDSTARSLEIATDSEPDNKPWWTELELAAKQYESSDNEQAKEEAKVLRRALEIVKQK
ncbi:hypothetical protein CR969_02955 [Candidatus Saccharibacteria bacterium]|nr:MAG: hypothetical protein CR969_02955 [Candidatus Saccharibacteria bacterium]